MPLSAVCPRVTGGDERGSAANVSPGRVPWIWCGFSRRSPPQQLAGVREESLQAGISSAQPFPRHLLQCTEFLDMCVLLKSVRCCSSAKGFVPAAGDVISTGGLIARGVFCSPNKDMKWEELSVCKQETNEVNIS